MNADFQMPKAEVQAPRPLPTKSCFGAPIASEDAPLYAASIAAMHARLSIQDALEELKGKQRMLGKQLRAAALVEKKADRKFLATPSGVAHERAIRHYMAEQYGPHHLLPEERAAFLATHPQFVKPVAA